jgi:hypothetical protein
MQVEPSIIRNIEMQQRFVHDYDIFRLASDRILTTYQTCIVTDTENAKFCTFDKQWIE